MAKTQIAEFTIYLRDPVLVAQLQSQLSQGHGALVGALIALPTGGFGVLRGPAPAGAEFGALAGGPALPLIDARNPPPTTGNGYIVSQWFADPQYPTDRAVFTLDHTWWWGGSTKFYWSGKFALAPTTEATVGTPGPGLPIDTVATRYWVHGFEGAYGPETGGVPPSNIPDIMRRCPAASRTGDGLGARGVIGNIAGRYDAYHAANLRPARTNTLTEVWERFYVRPLRFGSNTNVFWATHSGLFAGFEIGITPTGAWALYAVPNTSSGPWNLVATFGQAVLGSWARFDVFAYFGTPNSIVVRVNGVKLAQASVTGFVGAHYWQDSGLGPGVHFATGSEQNDHEMDFDDWIGGAIPATRSLAIPAWNVAVPYGVGAAVSYSGSTYVATAASTGQTPAPTGSTFWALAADPVDFRSGSHVVRVVPDGVGPAHDPSWVGNFRTLLNRGHIVGVGYPGLLSSTAGAVLDLTLPLATSAENHPQSLGIAAWRVVTFVQHDSPGTLPGLLGYQVGADAPLLTPLTGESTMMDFEAMTGQPSTGALLPPGETLRLQYVKASDTAPCRVSAVWAVVELIGIFGPEDGLGIDPATYPPPVPVHMNRHPRTSWATETLPAGAVIAIGGTYVGNGTGQDLLLPLPVTWLQIRRAVNDLNTPTRWTPGALWQTYGLSSSPQYGAGIHHVDTDPTFVPDPDADQQMQVRVRLSGASPGGSTNDTNEVGVTYQYLALLDPAARFSRAFATSARPVGTTPIPGLPRTWPLDDLTFVPEVAYLVNEYSGQGISTPSQIWKTPGHAADAATDLVGTALADALTFGSGAITIRTGVIRDTAEQASGIAFRRQDGNTDDPRPLFMGSYVGDGAASRTITFGATGKRPLYAHVGALAGAAQYHRDPSHTGVFSTSYIGQGPGTTPTALTAGGPDSFTVGSLLNANGATYGFWGIYGGTEAGNNGWSTNGTFVIPSDTRKPPGWVEPVPDPDPPDGPDGPGEPEPPPPDGYPEDPGDPGSDIFTECVLASTRVVNLALQEIGITKQITSLGRHPVDPLQPTVVPDWIDTSQEAFAARMIYRTLVDTVLRDDEWAFTREYATLTATAGSRAVPVNPDWTYTYTLPIDCLRVKRICTPDTKRGYSTTPIPFDRRSASLGYVDVLLTNEPGGEVLPEPAAGAPRTITIEYAKRISCAARVSDSQFRECLVFRLAAGLAKGLGRDAADADRCLRNYNLARPRGLVNQANDQEPQRPVTGNPDWITGR